MERGSLREKRRGIIISRDEDAKGRRSPSMEKSRWSFSLAFFATSLLPDNETLYLRSRLSSLASVIIRILIFKCITGNACALRGECFTLASEIQHVALRERYESYVISYACVRYHKKFLMHQNRMIVKCMYARERREREREKTLSLV